MMIRFQLPDNKFKICNTNWEVNVTAAALQCIYYTIANGFTQHTVSIINYMIMLYSGLIEDDWH